MSAPPEQEPQPKRPPRRRWKWTRRLIAAVVVLHVVVAVVLFGGRVYFRATGQRALGAETAGLDAEDPGWRFDDLRAARERAAPPEAEDSAAVVRKVRAATPTEWREWVKQQPTPGDNDGPPVLNRRQALEDLTRDDDLADATRAARELGLTLRDYPRGFHTVVVTDAPFVESLEETQGAREVAHLMKTDALLAAQERDAVRGLRAARAILNTGRSIGDEPTLISSLVRIACGVIAAETAMRVLALSDPTDALPELAALQSALFAEAEEPVVLNGLRGERAVTNRYFDAINSGKIGADALARMGGMKASAENRVVFYFRRAFFPEDQRRYLKLMTELIDAAKGPPHARLERCNRVEAELRANWDVRYRLHALMLPAAQKVMESGLRHRAELLSAATLIACERFRIAHGRWPESLAELPKDLLPGVPTDPYTGEPIGFAKLPDGISVCSAAPKTVRNSEQKRLTNPLGGTEVGWRLYDLRHRGLPPLPPKPKAADAPDALP